MCRSGSGGITLRPISYKGIGLVFAMLSGIFWGTNGTFCTLLSNLGFDTYSIAILAPSFNLVFFSVLLIVTNKSGFIVQRNYFGLLILSGLASAITNTSFVKSVSYFPVGIVSTLIFCNVFVIMIISRIVFKSKITLKKVGAAITAIFGICLVLDVFSQGFQHNSKGLIWIIITILTWSTMMVLEKYLLDQGVDGNSILMYSALFAVLILSISSPPLTVISQIIQVTDQTNGYALLVILGFGFIPQIGCYSLYMKGLKYIEPSYMQIMYSLDPVVASILGFLVFNQTMRPLNIVGICIIIGVVIYVQITETRAGIESKPDMVNL